jgi:predicted RNA-binding Zn-ribbon protein involved in translation (DUF1610 family)
MRQYDHEILSSEQADRFVASGGSDACPECGETMTQRDNPTGGDSWWFTCPNGHALWIGK